MKEMIFDPHFWLRVLICLILSLLPIRNFENIGYDLKFKLKPYSEPSKSIVIIETDSDEFLAIKDNYNFYNFSTPASLAKNLFLWDTKIIQTFLVKALNENPANIVMTSFYNESILDFKENDDLKKIFSNPKILWSSTFDDEMKFIHTPSKLSSNYGYNNLFHDDDGSIRSFTLTKNDYNSLAEKIFSLNKLNSNFLKQKKLINFAGSSGSFRSCKLIDFLSLDSLKTCPSLEHKIVIFTKSAIQSETQQTSFKTPYGPMSRGEILANILNTIENNNEIFDLATLPLRIIINLLIIILIAIIIGKFSTLKSIFNISFVILFYFIFSQFLFVLLQINLPIISPMFAIVISYFIFSAFKMAHQENKEWMALKEAEYLKNVDQMKSNFLSLISHDLKTPIAKIQAITERLKKEKTIPKEFNDLFLSIENSNNELKNYILNILNLSKIENSGIILNKKSNDINAVIEEQIDRHRLLASRKNIDFETDLEPMFSLEFDEDLIKQVLSNLIDNAIKYSPENSSIIIKSHEENNFCHVDVIDSGTGIPQDKIDLLFKKFSRLTPYTGDAVKGTGLGLYLSKYFIEMHGGTITVKQTRLGGSRFQFSLPV